MSLSGPPKPPPPKPPGRPKLFGRPEALLVETDGPRIAMPPPPPAPAPETPPEPTPPATRVAEAGAANEADIGTGPARVFIGRPGTAPPARLAPTLFDDDTSDEAARTDGWGAGGWARGDEGVSVSPRVSVAAATLPPAGFSLGLERPVRSTPMVDVPRKGPALRLAPSLEPADIDVLEAPDAGPAAPQRGAAWPREPDADDDGVPVGVEPAFQGIRVARPLPASGRKREGALPGGLDATRDFAEEPTAPQRRAAEVVPPTAPAAERALWEDLPESGPAPRPVVSVRRAMQVPKGRTPAPRPAPPPFTPVRAHTITPNPEKLEPAPKTDPGVNRQTVSRPGLPPPAPTRDPMPLAHHRPRMSFPPPGAAAPRSAQRSPQATNTDGGIGVAPFALLGVGFLLAFAAWMWTGLPAADWMLPYLPAHESPEEPGSERSPEGKAQTEPGAASGPSASETSGATSPGSEPGPADAKNAAEEKKEKSGAAASDAGKPKTEATRLPATTANTGTGMLRIKCDKNATISIDGVRKGTCAALAPLELPAGRHVIRAVAGGRSLSNEVRIDQGVARVVEFNFD